MRASGLVLIAIAGGCKGKAKPVVASDAAVARVDAVTAADWPELAELPHATPRVVIELPAPGTPLQSVVGPVAIGDLAVVGTSALGFVAIDWRAGQVAWRRAAGAHLAPPLAHAGGVLLVGDCERAPLAPTGKTVLGCWRAVSIHGVDVGAGVIAGETAAVAAFAAARGGDALVATGEHQVTWRRDEAAVAIDLATDAVRAVPPAPPTVIARHKGREWRIALEDEVVVARDAAGAEAWRLRTRVAAILGVIPGQGAEVPMLRAASVEGRAGGGLVDVLDFDATGSRRGQAGSPVPGIGVIGHAFAAGATALAVRLDTTLRRDYVTAHEPRGSLVWVWQLPERPRADPVGLAITDDAVLVFHDGDRLSILPAVSRMPTPTGTGPDASKNATP